MPLRPLLSHRLRYFPRRQVGSDHRTLLLKWHRYRYTSIEHWLNSHIRISYYDWRIVSRIAIVSPGQQIPPLTRRSNVKNELSRRRHRPVLLTITAAGTSPASRLGPLVPAADGMLSNAETPGVSTFGPPPAAACDVVAIPNGDTAVPGIALESSSGSALHSLSASATLIAIGAPPADSCCDFTLIDSIIKNPRNPPSPKTSGSARCSDAVARNRASCTAGFVNDACHTSSNFSRSRSSPTHCSCGLLSITFCSANSYAPADS